VRASAGPSARSAPCAAAEAALSADQRFLTLYRELWYRHVYSRLSPDGEDRFHSYDNYCDFFNFVLSAWWCPARAWCMSG
jgi:hypothetical protein